MVELSQNETKENSMPDQIFAGYHIAIVTDSENVASVLSKAFVNRGGKVSAFADGQKAIEAARNNRFHVLIVTEGIAQYDAAYCAKVIREQKSLQVDVLWHIGKESIPLMDGFLPRPFRPIELLKPIYERLIVKAQKPKDAVAGQGTMPVKAGSGAGVADSSPAAPPAQSAASAQPPVQAKAPLPSETAARTIRPAVSAQKGSGLKKILVVDDEEDLRDVTITILKDEGYEVLSACNGLAALELIKKHRDIAIMLLDLKMPGFNGMQLLTAVRNLGLGMDNSHIIIVSAFQRPELIETAKKLGVTHWVSKPFNPDLLLEYIHKVPVAK